jgi:hypothetical protein
LEAVLTIPNDGAAKTAATDPANDNRTAEPDFMLHDHGSIVILVPRTEAAKDWREAHLPEDAMEWAGGIANEPRYVGDILRGIAEDSLRVER